MNGQETSTREWPGGECASVAGRRVRVSGRETSMREWQGDEYA